MCLPYVINNNVQSTRSLPVDSLHASIAVHRSLPVYQSTTQSTVHRVHQESTGVHRVDGGLFTPQPETCEGRGLPRQPSHEYPPTERWGARWARPTSAAPHPSITYTPPTGALPRARTRANPLHTSRTGQHQHHERPSTHAGRAGTGARHGGVGGRFPSKVGTFSLQYAYLRVFKRI